MFESQGLISWEEMEKLASFKKMTAKGGIGLLFICAERELCKIREEQHVQAAQEDRTGQGRTGSQQKGTVEACPPGAER